MERDDGLELGSITEVPYMGGCSRAYAGAGTWMAISSAGGCKYFVHYERAVKWLERKSNGYYPISRLNEFLR